MKFLDKAPYSVLILASAWMLVAPVRPVPHFYEKMVMLQTGTLNKPVDIFDLLFHTAPLIVLMLKLFRSRFLS